MTWDLVNTLVPRRRGQAIEAKSRKSIFATQKSRDGESSFSNATITSAMKLRSLVMWPTSNSRYASVAKATKGQDCERRSSNGPFMTKASQIARETFSHDCIQRCALFTDRDPQFLERLVRDFHVQLFLAGDTIITQGDRGETMFFLHRGEVEVLVDNTLIRKLSDGTLFGELSVLGISSKRTATVRAAIFCDCRIISHRSFKQALRSFPKEKAFFTIMASERRTELAEIKKEKEKQAKVHRESIMSIAGVRRKSLHGVKARDMWLAENTPCEMEADNNARLGQSLKDKPLTPFDTKNSDSDEDEDENEDEETDTPRSLAPSGIGSPLSARSDVVSPLSASAYSTSESDFFSKTCLSGAGICSPFSIGADSMSESDCLQASFSAKNSEAWTSCAAESPSPIRPSGKVPFQHRRLGNFHRRVTVDDQSPGLCWAEAPVRKEDLPPVHSQGKPKAMFELDLLLEAASMRSPSPVARDISPCHLRRLPSASTRNM